MLPIYRSSVIYHNPEDMSPISRKYVNCHNPKVLLYITI